MFIDFTWAEVGRQARIMATCLNSLGLPPKSNIGLVSKNCAYWIIADLAILMSGHVSVPFYPTLTEAQLRQVLEHSECRVLFVGKLDGWDAVKPGVPTGIHKIAFPSYTPGSPSVDADAIQWADVLANHAPMTGNSLPNRSDLFTIIYTSGTTGNPKGVMITYDAVAEVMGKTREQMRYDIAETRFFSYLPLCHIAERNVVEATGIATGGTIYFAESLESFAKNLAVARPTHFLAVPRIWTKFQLGILAKMPQQKLDTLLRIPIVSGLVKRKIRQGLGLNGAKLIITGAAPMPISLVQWFRRLGIVIQEAYGMTENLGAVSMMPRRADRQTIAQGLQQTLNALNGRVHTYERVRKLIVMKEPWTVENNLMTPTMKMKRNGIDARYETQYEPWFGREEVIVWEE